MKATALKNKLNKLNIEFSAESNGYNVDLNFIINGINFVADYTENNDEILSFSRIICYDSQTQELQIRTFDNLNQVIKYANR